MEKIKNKILISIKNAQKYYIMGDSKVVALNNVNFQVKEGEFIALMGPSGSGKSTMMNILGLLDQLDEGEYFLNNKNINNLSENEITFVRSQTIGFIFQQFNLLSRTTSLENVYMPHFYLSFEDDEKDKKYYLQRAKDLLTGVGLGTRLHHAPNELSGGQQQRVAIARSLMNNPQIILADEPTGNLDTKSGEEIMSVLTELNNQGKTIILVTHEDDIAKYAKRIIRMRDGVIVEDYNNSSRREVAIIHDFPNIHDEHKLDEIHKKKYLKTFFEYIKHAYKAITSNFTRSLLSMLGILIGVGSVIAMLALGRGARESIRKSMEGLGTNLLKVRPGSHKVRGLQLENSDITQFTPRDAVEIKKIPEVKDVAMLVSGKGQLTYENNNYSTEILAASLNYNNMRGLEPTLGRYITKKEDESRARVAVIGTVPWKELFAGKNPIGSKIKINKISFKVIGILPEKSISGWQDPGDIIIIPLNTGMKRLFGKKYLDSLEVQAHDSNKMDELEEKVSQAIIKVHNLLPHKYDTFRIFNMAEMQKTANQMGETMSLLLASIAAISLVVGGIGIMNIMLVSVTERTREIGLRKAIGAKSRDILGQFLIESMAISGAGGFLGICLGYLVVYLISRFANWETALLFTDILISCFFSMVIGIIFGIWPAYNASKKRPIEALRYE